MLALYDATSGRGHSRGQGHEAGAGRQTKLLPKSLLDDVGQRVFQYRLGGVTKLRLSATDAA